MESWPAFVRFLLALLIIILCGLILIGYGSIAFATFTESPGLNGDQYAYYHMDRIVFGLYNLFFALAALFIIARLIYVINAENWFQTRLVYFYFIILIVILVIGEAYLSTRFVGKG